MDAPTPATVNAVEFSRCRKAAAITSGYTGPDASPSTSAASIVTTPAGHASRSVSAAAIANKLEPNTARSGSRDTHLVECTIRLTSDPTHRNEAAPIVMPSESPARCA